MDITTLKERKKQLNLSYDDLAEMSGVPKTTITNIFLGRTEHPRIDTVQAIEKALELSSDITAEERAAGWTETKKASLTPDEDAWLDLYNRLSAHGKTSVEAVTALIENYLGALELKP